MVCTVRCSCRAAHKCNMHTGILMIPYTKKSQQQDHASCRPELKPHVTIMRHHLMLALVTRNTVLYVCCKRTCGRQRLGAGHIGVGPGLRLTWPSAAALQSSVCIAEWRICVRSTQTLLRSAAHHASTQPYTLGAALSMQSSSD